MPPREESLLSLEEDKAVEMQVWGGAILPVTKLKCSFDKSFCVVDEETREMLEMYRMVLRPLAFRQLHKRDSYEMHATRKFEQTMQRNKDLQVLLKNAVHNFDTVLFHFVHKIKIACAPARHTHVFQDNSSLKRAAGGEQKQLQLKNIKTCRKWTSIQNSFVEAAGSLLEGLKPSEKAVRSYLQRNDAVVQRLFLRTESNAPLSQTSHYTSPIYMQLFGHTLPVTELRKMREKTAVAQGKKAKKATEIALTHTESVADSSYREEARMGTEEEAIDAGLDCAYFNALLPDTAPASPRPALLATSAPSPLAAPMPTPVDLKLPNSLAQLESGHIKVKWSKEDKQQLRDAVLLYGTSFSQIAQIMIDQSNLAGRPISAPAARARLANKLKSYYHSKQFKAFMSDT